LCSEQRYKHDDNVLMNERPLCSIRKLRRFAVRREVQKVVVVRTHTPSFTHTGYVTGSGCVESTRSCPSMSANLRSCPTLQLFLAESSAGHVPSACHASRYFDDSGGKLHVSHLLISWNKLLTTLQLSLFQRLKTPPWGSCLSWATYKGPSSWPFSLVPPSPTDNINLRRIC
jgi:hypothetical protein